MDRMSFQILINCPMKHRSIILIVSIILLLGCTTSRNDIQIADPDKLAIGETVYVCGCPMLCCNTISRTAGGRCDCNQPLRRGTVSMIRDGRVSVKIDDGREKRFFTKNR